jgi:hypothetical protein
MWLYKYFSWSSKFFLRLYIYFFTNSCLWMMLLILTRINWRSRLSLSHKIKKMKEKKTRNTEKFDYFSFFSHKGSSSSIMSIITIFSFFFLTDLYCVSVGSVSRKIFHFVFSNSWEKFFKNTFFLFLN